MNCPACKDSTLSMTERQGVEIDYCPRCRGVWLDRGELDKIIEKSASSSEALGNPAPTLAQNHQTQQSGSFHQQPHYKGYKRKKSFLEELFD